MRLNRNPSFADIADGSRRVGLSVSLLQLLGVDRPVLKQVVNHRPRPLSRDFIGQCPNPRINIRSFVRCLR